MFCWAWAILFQFHVLVCVFWYKGGNLIGAWFVMSNRNLGLGLKRLYWYLIIGCINWYRCFLVSYTVDVWSFLFQWIIGRFFLEDHCFRIGKLYLPMFLEEKNHWKFAMASLSEKSKCNEAFGGSSRTHWASHWEANWTRCEQFKLKLVGLSHWLRL